MTPLTAFAHVEEDRGIQRLERYLDTSSIEIRGEGAQEEAAEKAATF